MVMTKRMMNNNADRKLKCIGEYRGYYLFTEDGRNFAVRREAVEAREAKDDDIILGGEGSDLRLVKDTIDSRSRPRTWPRK